MRWFVAVAVLAHAGGCDAVFRLDHIEGGSADARHDGVTSDTVDTSARCSAALDELFSDGEPCSPWATANTTAAAMLEETDLGLVVTPSTVMTGSRAGCFGNAGYPFGQDGVMVEVDEVLTGASDEYTTLELTADMAVGVSDGRLVMANNLGTTEYAQLAYVPADMRWWRILPTSDRSGIEAQYSADGRSWSRLGITPFVVPENVAINVQAGVAATSSGAGRAVFRRLIVCR
ncbi:MAG: hypothetical protein HOV81_08950 [Kofleriaceae bacterium]|nr:hypothetical protein [Kofleriaceae bacterium]